MLARIPRLAGAAAATPEPVHVASPSGARLVGHFLAGRSRATVVLTHGYGGTHAELRPVSDALWAAGFSVFAYDLRGCGASTGAITFGAREQDDLIAVVDELARRPDVDPRRIGAYGFSMGGGTTLLAAARDRRISAVAADSAWSDVKHWLRPTVRSLLHPRDPLSLLALKRAERRYGFDLGSLRPARSISTIAPRPLLLMHGTDDDVVPAADAYENASNAGPEAELWIVEGGRHGDSLAPGGAASSERLVEFFRRGLRTETAP